MDYTYDIIIVGGGAAGFFCAIQAAEFNPALRIVILEKANKVLSKVRVSGGGRCNVTHNCFNPFQLAAHYPRGERSLKEMFKVFDAKDMVEWLETRSVPLKAEDDGRMFPVSDSSQTIIDCFMKEAIARKVTIELGIGVESVHKTENGFTISTKLKDFYTKALVIATGGSPNLDNYSFLVRIGHSIIRPIPSLFTFNDPAKHFADLMGVSVSDAEVRIQGTKFHQRGPVLITHWGLSGPAVIKLSAWAAEHLFEKKYEFLVFINWTTYSKEEEIRSVLDDKRKKSPRQKIRSSPQFNLPSRLWEKLLLMSSMDAERVWGELPHKVFNKLVENLFRCAVPIKGKTTFKEEFVTCGGVDLKEIDLQRMESKIVKNLFFAGEVLNIDGETGGFNFQSAWTTAHIAAKAIAKK